MPMIDIYAIEGTFDDPHVLAAEAAATPVLSIATSSWLSWLN
ncbi:MAG: hypothetical protein QOG98_1264 [Pseudonocardiales bacterium]|nr:hypothetical protein [Pseudonocardiales bacterium]